ncbi:MAG: glycosyltransferase family 2 protein [Saprospiraceae bacterium]|nr:glycosyltransferase family 2 protein [Saprospiraceae bacterium]
MNQYLQQRTLFAPLIYRKPSLNLGMVVVIPAYDEPFLLLSLMNLSRCTLPLCDVEVIVVINNSEQSSQAVRDCNQETYLKALQWAKKNNKHRIKFHILYVPDLPSKSAGVGLARKIGMDEACWRLMKIKNKKGVIVCFDADSRCETNYFLALEEHFKNHPKTPACNIYFEHPIHGAEHEDEVYEAIVPYELHLRYYIQAQRLAGFPHAYHTVGSSMAVRVMAYQQQGGMNKRKAGEDFYFLHKFISLGRFSECLSTKVIPSPRPSHRVPFGTGRAVNEIVASSGTYDTYHLSSFFDLKNLFDLVPALYKAEVEEYEDMVAELPASIQDFLTQVDYLSKWQEIKINTASRKAFITRFYKWFNAFMLMKYVHFARDHHYPNIPVGEAAARLLTHIHACSFDDQQLPALLQHYRSLDQLPMTKSPLAGRQRVR